MNFSQKSYEARINGINESAPSGFLTCPANLDNIKFNYIAIRAKGDGLAAHRIPVRDRDVVFIREIEQWAEPNRKNDALHYIGKLVTLSINGVFVIRELVTIDFLRRRITLFLPEPETTEEYDFGMVLKFYVLDAVQSGVPSSNHNTPYPQHYRSNIFRLN